MKKIILFAILLTGGITFASAQSDSTKVQTDSTAQVVATVQVATPDKYKEVAVTDLSDVVQAAVKTLAGDTLDVTKVEFNADDQLAKVTFANKSDQSEKVVILDKDGKEVIPDTTAEQ